jgi:hypothetical protein
MASRGDGTRDPSGELTKNLRVQSRTVEAQMFQIRTRLTTESP